MELSSALDEKQQIYILRVSGVYRRPGDGFVAQRHVLESFAEHGCNRVLLDVREAEIISGTMRTYDTASSRPELIDELQKFKFAALYTSVGPDERFFEDTAVNRGLNVRIFEDHAEAVSWLVQP